MKEFSKRVEIKSLLFRKSEFAKLFEELIKDFGPVNLLELSFEAGDATYSFESIDEFLNDPHLTKLDSLRIMLYEKAEQEDKKTITLTIYRWGANFSVSSSNETWFRGKLLQLNDYFNSHKPWYSFCSRPIFTGILFFFVGVFAQTAYVSLLIEDLVLAIQFSILMVTMAIITFLQFTDKVFPKIKFIQTDRAFLTKENILIFLTSIPAIAVIIDWIRDI